MACPVNLVKIKPEWIDHNGHLNVAYFVMAFDYATEAAFEEWGIGFEYKEQSGCSVYILGMNVDYIQEVHVDEEVAITTQMLDCDHKRVHYFHTMQHAGSGEVVATNECLAMNISMEEKRSVSFPEGVQQSLAAVLAQHAGMKRPDKAGRQLGIGKKTALGAR